MTSSRPAGTAFDRKAASVGDAVVCGAALSAGAGSAAYADAETANDIVEAAAIIRLLMIIEDSCPQKGIKRRALRHY
jgi:hypothetical protein